MEKSRAERPAEDGGLAEAARAQASAAGRRRRARRGRRRRRPAMRASAARTSGRRATSSVGWTEPDRRHDQGFERGGRRAGSAALPRRRARPARSASGRAPVRAGTAPPGARGPGSSAGRDRPGCRRRRRPAARMIRSSSRCWVMLRSMQREPRRQRGLLDEGARDVGLDGEQRPPRGRIRWPRKRLRAASALGPAAAEQVELERDVEAAEGVAEVEPASGPFACAADPGRGRDGGQHRAAGDAEQGARLPDPRHRGGDVGIVRGWPARSARRARREPSAAPRVAGPRECRSASRRRSGLAPCSLHARDWTTGVGSSATCGAQAAERPRRRRGRGSRERRRCACPAHSGARLRLAKPCAGPQRDVAMVSPRLTEHLGLYRSDSVQQFRPGGHERTAFPRRK